MFNHEARLALLAAIPEDELFTFFVEGAYKGLVPGETWTQFVFGGDEPFKPEPIATADLTKR